MSTHFLCLLFFLFTPYYEKDLEIGKETDRYFFQQFRQKRATARLIISLRQLCVPLLP